MADAKTYELDELTIRPGTYFNPQTDIVLIVDDSPDVDTEIFNMEDFEGADWVLIGDDAPVDESRRDAMIERFQVTQRPASDDLTEDVVDDEDDAPPPVIEEWIKIGPVASLLGVLAAFVIGMTASVVADRRGVPRDDDDHSSSSTSTPSSSSSSSTTSSSEASETGRPVT